MQKCTTCGHNVFKILLFPCLLTSRFREDVQVEERMMAIGNLICQHKPTVICLQVIYNRYHNHGERGLLWNIYIMVIRVLCQGQPLPRKAQSVSVCVWI
jgi:hypothetical protein